MTVGELTIRGRCLLAAGFAAALCALLLDERDLLRIAVFVVLLPLLAVLVAVLGTNRAGLGIGADRQLVPPQIPADGSCRVELSVRATRWSGGGLLLEERLPEVLGEAPRFVVERLPRKVEARLHYPLGPAQRGVHLLGPLVARITDPFGLVESRREITGHSRLVVTPVVVALTGLPAGQERGGRGGDIGTGAGNARHGPGADAVVLRSYQHGDDLRKVHWRATARHDEPMVRMEEQPGRDVTAVLLDHRMSAHRGRGARSSLEYAVSLVASICAHLQGHGLRVQLVGADGRALSGAIASTTLALAGLEPSVVRELRGGPAIREGRQVIAVLGSTAPATATRLAQHRRPGAHNHAVLLDVAAWGSTAQDNPANVPADSAGPPADPASATRALVTAGWSVVTATPEQSVWSIWERLCVASRSSPTTPDPGRGGPGAPPGAPR